MLLLLLPLTGCSFSVDYGGTAYSCSAGDPACPPAFVCDTAAGVCVPDPAAGGDAAPGDAAASHDPEWWDPAYPRRRRLDIRNEAIRALDAGHPVGVALELDADELGAPRFGGVRVVLHEDGVPPLELDRVVDHYPGGDDVVWFRLVEPLEPDDVARRYWLYLGGPAEAVPPDDPTLVFDTWAGFDVVPAGWSFLSAPTLEGGALRLVSGNGARTAEEFAPGVAVDIVLDLPVLAQDIGAGFIDTTGFSVEPPMVAWVNDPFLAGMAPVWDSGTGGDGGASIQPGNVARRYAVERDDGQVWFGYEGQTVWQTFTPGALDIPLQVLVANGSPGTLRVLEVRTRPVALPPPSVEVRGPEDYTSGL
jgi:hypothetical protein